MDNKKLYVDFHIIQTVPPSCVNRDDTGRPKTAVFGGVTRARVSSQSWKHAVRKYFEQEIYSAEESGYRTKYAVDIIAKEIKKLSDEFNDEKAEKAAANALTNAGVKTNAKNGKTITGALFFISAKQAQKLAELAVNSDDDKKKYKQALCDAPSVDIALFGRMVADDPELNADASCQVAHSISTHKVQNEYDYFTAEDDCSQLDNAGAGHLGTMEFNSSTLYRYANINVSELAKQIGNESVSEAVRNFAEAFISSMPDGKENSYANRTVPNFVYVTIRRGQPINLCGAFEKPVCSTDGYAEKSIAALEKYADKVYSDYCSKPEKSYVIGAGEFLDAEKVNFNELLDKISNEVI